VAHRPRSGAVKLNIIRADASASLSISGGSGLANRAWHHIVVSFDAAGIPSVYAEGTRVILGTVAALPNAAANTFLVGGLSASVSAYDRTEALHELRLSRDQLSMAGARHIRVPA